VLVLRSSYAEALDLLREAPPPALAHSETAVRRKTAQGIALDFLQRFDEAQRALSEAQQLAAAFQPDLLGDVLQAQGNLEISRKNYPAASAAFHQALQLDRQRHLSNQETNVLGSLGYLAMWEEHYDEAIGWFKESLNRSQAVGSDYTVAKVLGNIGWNYSVVGDFENAEDLLKQADRASLKAGLPGDHVKWLNALSDVYFQQHRYDLAGSTSGEALLQARKIGDNRDITSCLNSSSDIALATGLVDAAEKYNREALAIEQAGLDQFGGASSTIISGRIAMSRRHFREAEETFQKVIRAPNMETPLRWQAQAYLAQAYAADNLPAVAEAEFRKAIGTIETARAAVERQDFRVSFLSSAFQFYTAYMDFLVSRGRSLDALAVADLSRSQSLAESLSLDSPSSTPSFSRFHPRSLAARFHSTFLFYSLGERLSYLWVITPQKISLLTLPPQEEIDALAKSYREALSTSPLDPLSTPGSSGGKLYSILVQPAAKLIPRDSRVILFPDGSLDTLNFETLVVPAPHPHYWIEDVTLSVADSLALLDRPRPATSLRNAHLLLVGDPTPADPLFPPLPQGPAEMNIVERYFPASHRDVLTGSSATPPAYLQADPGRFQFIHFVTHGTASRLQPLESAIILTLSGDSYKLYAREIITRPLHAFLVTISACNGAGNRAYAGEGLVGLSWAFLRAGAHNVISALWEVSDASTPKLMDSLYRGLNRGEDPATALRNAKLALLHSGGLYQKPYYWAPFQLYTGS